MSTQPEPVTAEDETKETKRIERPARDRLAFDGVP